MQKAKITPEYTEYDNGFRLPYENAGLPHFVDADSADGHARFIDNVGPGPINLPDEDPITDPDTDTEIERISDYSIDDQEREEE
jgi:hypothetical protein